MEEHDGDDDHRHADLHYRYVAEHDMKVHWQF